MVIDSPIPDADALCGPSLLLLCDPTHSLTGRILWLLPDEHDPSAKPQMVQVDQNAVRGPHAWL